MRAGAHRFRLPGSKIRLPVRLRLLAGFAGLALLSACASSSHVATAPSTNYFIDHAAGNYRPPGPASDPWGPYISIAASRFDVPQQWIRQVMQVESGGHQYIDGQLTVSPAGAMGLMQMEPETYQEMAARYGLGTDPFNPYDNIMAGTAYIHEMYAVYGSPGFLAAYNAGPGRVDDFEDSGRPLPHETTNYVAMIAPAIEGYYPSHRSAADQLALNTLPASTDEGILPVGFVPNAAPYVPETPDIPTQAPVQVAALVPPAGAGTDTDSADETPPALAATASATVPPPPQSHGFSLISSAMADTPAQPYVPMAAPVSAPAAQDLAESPAIGWAVQVGAYNSKDKAKAALGIAELSAVQSLMRGQAQVAVVHTGDGVIYRARFTGLAHSGAVDACQRLSHGPTGCVILSPDAQS